LVSEVEILFALSGKLLAVVLVPGQRVTLVLLLESVDLLMQICKDVGAVACELPILLLVVLGLLEGLAKLRILPLKVLGILCRVDVRFG